MEKSAPVQTLSMGKSNSVYALSNTNQKEEMYKTMEDIGINKKGSKSLISSTAGPNFNKTVGRFKPISPEKTNKRQSVDVNMYKDEESKFKEV